MDDFESLVCEVVARTPGIIGVDGELAAGKSTLAEMVAKRLGCVCLHLDDYLSPGQGSFLPSLQYGPLRAAMVSHAGTVVIEGICLLAVLKRLSLSPNYLIYLEAEQRFRGLPKSSLLAEEVSHYGAQYLPRTNANLVSSLEHLTMNRPPEVDIAYIRAKTAISITLAVGGLIQTISGALLLNAGLQTSATLKIMGAQLSAGGLGGIVLSTSVLWAYFAYLSRPKYSRTAETRRTTRADGSSEVFEHESSTQFTVKPDDQSRRSK